ncbi:kelch-like protein 26 [Physella acuta]|uniref:kelch-like protein 26 n=1 Tax=Physella acuta TaxID=109671 RepID=UPI0027DABE39|nr:kelch-like protein 26 [Physella acuta]
MNTPEICTEIIKCLKNIWADQLLLDFTIKIQDDTITCHKLVLAACSEFFQALFRSGMREVTENCVVLKDVSYEIFQLILKTLYTGVNVLTLDNFIHVWRAVHMLQINFMVQMCEGFAIASVKIDNWENIYTVAKHLGSTTVLDNLHRFMLRNFDQISLSATYLQLSFNEVRDLVKSQDLCVSSEDLVLESVIHWADIATECNTESRINKRKNIIDVGKNGCGLRKVYSDISINNAMIECFSRKNQLIELVSLVRTYLVSPSVLSRVYQHELCSENKNVRDIIVSALLYHAQLTKDGQWPSAAINRSCSIYTHVGVYVKDSRHFRAIRASDETWFDLPSFSDLKDCVQLVTWDGELYATGKPLNRPNENCVLFVFSENSWRKVCNLPCHNLLLLSHGQFIYILNKDDNVIYIFNPRNMKFKKCTQFVPQADVKHATVFANFLLLFCTETHNRVEGTAVHQFDLSSNVWTKLDPLDGPAEQLISFKNDKHSYILQTNGSLWVMSQPIPLNGIDFKCICKLWNCDKKLHGALTYNDKLIIFGNDPLNDPKGANKLVTVPGHVGKIKHWGHAFKSSNFVPVTLLKTS